MARRVAHVGTDRDFAVVARTVVESAIGEQLDGSPLEDPNAGKDAAAVARGRLGGIKGGKARAAALSPRQRQESAEKAIKARWRARRKRAKR